jgi:predicted nucleic acid-binding Zn ribbon protein
VSGAQTSTSVRGMRNGGDHRYPPTPTRFTASIAVGGSVAGRPEIQNRPIYLDNSPALSACVVWLLFRLSREGRGKRHLYSATLTLPGKDGPTSSEARRAARRFVREVGREGSGCGSWLVLDVSRRQRPHWHGLIISRRASKHLLERWVRLTGASPKAQRAPRVAGEGNEWDTSNTTLLDGLADVVSYAMKPLPPAAGDVPLSSRLVSSGALRAFRLRVLRGGLSKGTRRYRRMPGRPPETQDARTCAWCGEPLHGKRAGARSCSPSCRTLVSRERQRRLSALSEVESMALHTRAIEKAAAEDVTLMAALDALLREHTTGRQTGQAVECDGLRTTPGQVAPSKQCHRCGGALAPHKRNDSRFCSARCRVASWRETRARGANPSPAPSGTSRRGVVLKLVERV